MIDWILIGVFAILSYLLGNVNWAIIISKIKKVDIRSMGSGNPGTLNMSRNLGLKAGLLTFFLDILKGVIPTLVAYFVFKDKLIYDSGFYLKDFALYLCGFAVVIGHIYPVFMKFKGGKGIATSIGVFLTIEAVNGWGWVAVAIMALVAAALFIYFTEFGAMGSFIAITPPAISGSIRLYVNYGANVNTLCTVFFILTSMLIFSICLATWFAHRKNIKRMLAGEEHPTSIKEMVVKMKAKKLQEKQKNASNQDKID
ncbi:MAG: glycerol-3-phosphate acyltransferase [Clostridia bacterium]|nr:glycerol-3-phosphate acyltransferase [Clostridia bacterium]